MKLTFQYLSTAIPITRSSFSTILAKQLIIIVETTTSFCDFNSLETNQKIHDFMNSYSLKNLVKEPTCFKAENLTCSDLILTNRYRSCQHTTTIKTGLSNFLKMVVTVLKTTYQKTGPKIVNHRDYKNFTEQTFKQDLRAELQSMQAEDLDYNNFQDCFEKYLTNMHR